MSTPQVNEDGAANKLNVEASGSTHRTATSPNAPHRPSATHRPSVQLSVHDPHPPQDGTVSGPGAGVAGARRRRSVVIGLQAATESIKEKQVRWKN